MPDIHIVSKAMRTYYSQDPTKPRIQKLLIDIFGSDAECSTEITALATAINAKMEEKFADIFTVCSILAPSCSSDALGASILAFAKYIQSEL